MPINDPTAIGFSNNHLRTSSDTLAQTYYTAKSIVASWTAQGGTDLIPNEIGNIIEDGAGSGSDTRTVVDGAKANNIITRLSDYITAIEQPGVLDTILQYATNFNTNG